MMKFYVLWTTRALDDNFSVVTLDINTAHSSLFPGAVRAHFTRGTSWNNRGNDLINANSYFSSLFTASSSLLLRKVPKIMTK